MLTGGAKLSTSAAMNVRAGGRLLARLRRAGVAPRLLVAGGAAYLADTRGLAALAPGVDLAALGASLGAAPPPAAASAPAAPKLSAAYDVDVVVIGGGSGGLACAREAAGLGGKVTLFDYVVPTPQGTKWGLGGTCVNVGCIPKKLMHYAALLGQGLHDAAEFGWQLEPGKVAHSWGVLAAAVQNHIRGTNWGYRNALRDERVEYINASARLVDGHTVEYTDRKGGVKRIRAAHVVVAVGGRPRYPDGVEGAAEHGITSDDLFWLPHSPGRTLLVGAGYVALECAGLLTHIGCDATVMARGPVLRGFDGGMSDRIVRHMASTGTRFKRGAAPVRVAPEGTRVDPETGAEVPRYRVWWRSTEAGADQQQLESDVFDTVVFATGRGPATAGMGLAEAGVRLDAGGKVVGGHGGEGGAAAAGAHSSSGASSSIGSVLQSRDVSRSIYSETSSVPSVHAVGDVLAGRPELTPVAIRAGKLLAQRIMRGVLPTEGAAAVDSAPTPPSQHASSSSPLVMDYALVPTTVFTPLEYGAVGLSEEEAAAAYGADGIDLYHSAYDTLELSVAHRNDADGLPLPPQCYTKMVVTRAAPTADGGDGARQERVLGLHVLGPNAGEVVQGFATALRMGATRADMEATVGIHPTHAEEVVGLDTTKRSGGDFLKTSC